MTLKNSPISLGVFIKLELDFTDKDRLGFEGNAMAKEKGFSRDNGTLKGSGLLYWFQ